MPTYALRPKATERPGAASRPAKLSPGRLSRRLALAAPRVQRAVRVGGGAKKIDEAHYTTGPGRTIGTQRLVSSLIADPLRRVFASTTEMEEYANGKTDHVGDVATASAGTFWYRLPKDKVTVLGEKHNNVNGNVEDVILGLGTSRFMYEPFSEVASVGGIGAATGTQTRVSQISAASPVAGEVDRAKFNPDLENVVVKALTGTAITRNEFIAEDPAKMDAAKRRKWVSRPSVDVSSYGERAALYLALGIHLAKDLVRENFGSPTGAESRFVASARSLQQYYLANQTVLDAFMTTKDGNDLIGIYELTSPNGFQNLPVIKGFTLAFHEYGSRYLEQLGIESKNKTVEAEGKSLAGMVGATLLDFSTVRDELMFQKVLEARMKKYLIVGMGDGHRRRLASRLKLAGIEEKKVEDSLTEQKATVDGAWRA